MDAFDDWTAGPIGSFALSLAVRAETFKEGATVLRAAFEAGWRANDDYRLAVARNDGSAERMPTPPEKVHTKDFSK